MLLALLLATLPAAAADHPAALDCAAHRSLAVELPGDPPALVSAQTDGAAWLELREQGADIAPDIAGAIEITVPPRYGRWLVPLGTAPLTVRVARTTAAITPARVEVRLGCAGLLDSIAFAAWFGRAAAISSELMPVPAITSADATLARIATLEAAAGTGEQRALAAHLRAQTLYTVARTAESAAAFTAAERAWQADGDTALALSARVGRLEELIRAARYRDALELVQATPAAAATQPYLAQRVASARCLALRYLGELAAAADCYRQVETVLRDFNERVDVASTAQDLAEVLRYAGRGEEAAQHLALVHEFAVGPYAPQVRGRAYLLGAELQVAAGEVLAALGSLELAQSAFESVRATRWQANTMLRTATLYSQLGLLDEAFALADAALLLLPESDAPARYAAAQAALARIRLRAGQHAEAIAAARRAEAIYATLKMPAELDVTRELLARLLLQTGELDQADALLRSRSKISALDSQDWQLLAARIAAQRDEADSARQSADALRKQPLSLPRQVELASLEALLQARAGQPAQAHRSLLQSAERLRRLAGEVDNPVLQQLLIRQIAPLRAQSANLLLQDLDTAPPGTPANTRLAETAWSWARLATVPRRGPASPRTPAEAERARRYDEQVAAELLAPAGARPQPQPQASAPGRELLGLLSVVPTPAAAESAPANAATPSPLPQDAALLVLFEAQPRSVLLWKTHQSSILLPGPSLPQLRAQAAQLTALVSDPASDVAAIRRAAAPLSALLLSSAPLARAPKTLLVDAGGELAGIAWPVLSWPGDEAPLLERSDVSLVRLRQDCCRRPAFRPDRIQVLLAPQGSAAALPYLPSAEAEPRLIAAAVAGKGLRLDVRSAQARSPVLDALRQPSQWVHVAAHGTSAERGFGRSGLWLQSASASAQPEFLGALDVLGNGVGSSLVVLSACRLADNHDDGVRPALNFATAASDGGAGDVVAALWPISDSATALWVPEFYRRAVQDPVPDIAAALRAAQLRLRDSRAFRHPFYWASIVHLQDL